MASPTSPTTGRRRAHGVPTHPQLRSHRRAVAAWALANGHPLDRDALAVVVGLRSRTADGALDRRWTTDDVAAVVTTDAAIWCAVHGTARPPDVATALETYLRYLAAHRMLADGSDRPVELRRALAGLRARTGRERGAHPAGRDRRRAPVLPLG